MILYSLKLVNYEDIDSLKLINYKELVILIKGIIVLCCFKLVETEIFIKL